MELEIDIAPTEKDIDELKNALTQFNLSHIEVTKREPIAIWCRNEGNEKIGGISGNTFGEWLEVKYLWVSENYRKQNIGTTLLLKMEEVAKSRGCCKASVDTYDFQAKPFYEKNGFKTVLSLEDYPKSGRKYYLIKKI